MDWSDPTLSRPPVSCVMCDEETDFGLIRFVWEAPCPFCGGSQLVSRSQADGQRELIAGANKSYRESWERLMREVLYGRPGPCALPPVVGVRVEPATPDES